MDPVTALYSFFAGFFREYGVYAGLALVTGTALTFFSKLQTCQAARIGDQIAFRKSSEEKDAAHAAALLAIVKDTATLIERSSNTSATVTAALESRVGYFERIGTDNARVEGVVRDLRTAVGAGDDRVRGLLERIERFMDQTVKDLARIAGGHG